MTEPNAPRSLLLVDDEPAIAFAMCEYFESLGYRVDRAPDVERARELLVDTEYTVAIADLRLGVDGPDGLALIEEIKRAHPRTRTVLLTAYGSAEVEAKARRLGVDAFLHKPQRLSQVASIVDALAEGR